MGAPRPDRRLRGYAEIGAASLILGTSATTIQISTMPAGMLIVLRMALALNLILYFLAIRYTGVAVAIFLSYLAPVYLAFVAPLILKEKTERIVYVALAVGLAGMALILVPGLLLEGVELSAAGPFFGWAAGVMYAVYLLFAKSLRGLHVRSTAAVFTQSAFTPVVMLVPGLLAVSAADYQYTGVDFLMAALLGLVTIAYVEPVSAPLYALVLLGQRPSSWTIAGGALIAAAGILVVRYGGHELELEPVG